MAARSMEWESVHVLLDCEVIDVQLEDKVVQDNYHTHPYTIYNIQISILAQHSSRIISLRSFTPFTPALNTHSVAV